MVAEAAVVSFYGERFLSLVEVGLVERGYLMGVGLVLWWEGGFVGGRMGFGHFPLYVCVAKW